MSAASGGSGYFGGDVNVETSNGPTAVKSGHIFVRTGTGQKRSGSVLLATGNSAYVSGDLSFACGQSGFRAAVISLGAGSTDKVTGGSLQLTSGTSDVALTGGVLIQSQAASRATGRVFIGSGTAGRAGAVFVETGSSCSVGDIECMVEKRGNVSVASSGGVLVSSASSRGGTGGAARIITTAGAVRVSAGPHGRTTLRTSNAETHGGCVKMAMGKADASASAVIESGPAGDIAITGGTEAAACLCCANVSKEGHGGDVRFTGDTVRVAAAAAKSSTGGEACAASGNSIFVMTGAANNVGILRVGDSGIIDMRAGKKTTAPEVNVSSRKTDSGATGAVSVATSDSLLSADTGIFSILTGTSAGNGGTVSLQSGTSSDASAGHATATGMRDSEACATGDALCATGDAGTLSMKGMKGDETSAEACLSQGDIELVAGSKGELGIISLDGCIGFGIGAKRVRLEKSESGIIELISDVNVNTPDATDGSDQRIKKDLFAADIDDIHRRLGKVGLQTYGYKNAWCSMHACNETLVRGLIAQELRNVFPEHVDVLPSCSLPDTDMKMRDFHQINTLSLALDSIAGLQAQAGRYRVEMGSDDASSKLRVRSDNHASSGNVSLETGCASGVSSGGIHFRAGDAASGTRGGTIDLLTSANARSAGEARLCAGSGAWALTLSANDCLALNAGGGYRSSRIVAKVDNCGVVLGLARNDGASLTLLSGRGHATTGGDVVCNSGSSEVCAGGDVDYSAGRSSPSGGGATVTAGNGQMNSGSVDLFGASTVILGTDVGSLQSGDISLRSGRGSSNSGGVHIRSRCSHTSRAGDVTLRSGFGHLKSKSTQVILRASKDVDIMSKVANTLMSSGQANAPKDAQAGSIHLRASEPHSRSESSSINILGCSRPSEATLSILSGNSNGRGPGGSAVISGGAHGGKVTINSYGKKSDQVAVCIASQPATSFASGCVHLGSGAAGKAGVVNLCGGSSSDADGSGVAVRAGSGPLRSGAGGCIGGGAGHGSQGGDLKLAAGNGREAPGGTVAVSSGTSSTASSGSVVVGSGTGMRDSGSARVSSGAATSGKSGPLRLGTGVSTRASGCMAITVDGGGGSDQSSPLLSLGAGSIPCFETPEGQGGSGFLSGGHGLSGGSVLVSGGSGAWAAAGRVKLDAGLSVGSQGGDIYVASAPGQKSAGNLGLWAAFSRCRGSGGNVQLCGGNSASFGGGSLRMVSGCSAELNVVTNPSSGSGAVIVKTGNLPFGEAGHIRIVSGRECCRGGAIVALAGSGPGRSWRGGSVDAHAGKSCLSGGDTYVVGGAGSVSEGGCVYFGGGSSAASTTGGQMHFKSGGSEVYPGVETSGRMLVASGLSETSGCVTMLTKPSESQGGGNFQMALRVGQSSGNTTSSWAAVGGEMRIHGNCEVCAHGGTGEFGGDVSLNGGATELLPGAILLESGGASAGDAGAGGLIGMKAGNAREGGMLILESGHSINGIGGNIQLLGVGRDSSDDAFTLTTTSAYRGEVDETSGGICIMSGHARPQNEVGGSIELKSGNSQTTGSITASIYASRFDAGGKLCLRSGSGAASAGLIRAAAGAGSTGGGARMLSGSGTGGAGGDVRLCSGKSETGISGMALVNTATGHMSGAIKIAGKSGLRRQSGHCCMQTKGENRHKRSGHGFFRTGSSGIGGSGQLHLNAGAALVGKGGGVGVEAGSSGAGARGGTLVQLAGRGSVLGGSIQVCAGGSLVGRGGVGAATSLRSGSGRQRDGPLLVGAGTGNSQIGGELVVGGGRSEMSSGGCISINAAQAVLVFSGHSQIAPGVIFLKTESTAHTPGEIDGSAGAASSGGSVLLRGGGAKADGGGGGVRIGAGEAVHSTHRGGSFIASAGNGDAIGSCLLVCGGESARGDSGTIGVLSGASSTKVGETGDVYVSSGRSHSSGPTCISTGTSRDDANVNGCCLSAGGGFVSTGGSVHVSSTAGGNLRSIEMRSGNGRVGESIQLFGAGAKMRAGSISFCAGETSSQGKAGCLLVSGDSGSTLSGHAGSSEGERGGAAIAMSGANCQRGGTTGLCTVIQDVEQISGRINIASQPATSFASGCVHLGSGAAGKAGVVNLCGGSSSDADGSGVAVRAGSGPLRSGAGGCIGGGAGHGSQGGDLKLAAGNGREAPGGTVAVSSGTSSTASSGSVVVGSGTGMRDSGSARVSSGAATSGKSGPLRLGTGHAAAALTCNILTGSSDTQGGGMSSLCAGDGLVGGDCTFHSGEGHASGSFRVAAGIGPSANGATLLDAGRASSSTGGSVKVGAGKPGFSSNVDILSSGEGGRVTVRSGLGDSGGVGHVTLEQGASSLTVDDTKIQLQGARFYSRSNHHRVNTMETGDRRSHISMHINDRACGTKFDLRQEEGVASAVACLPLRMTESTYSSDSRIKRDISQFPAS